MADEITKADIDAAVKAATEKFQESIDKLEAKNAELLDEAKKAKAELRKVKDISPEDVAAIEAERDKALADLTEANKALKDAAKAKEAAETKLKAESEFTHKLLVQDGLKSALIENGVKDADFIDTLSAKFARDAKVIAEGDARKVMLGDKALSDAIKEFAGSESGKKFVAAAQNSGGGAPGGSGASGGGKTATRAEFDAMDHGARMTFSKEGGKVIDAAA